MAQDYVATSPHAAYDAQRNMRMIEHAKHDRNGLLEKHNNREDDERYFINTNTDGSERRNNH